MKLIACEVLAREAYFCSSRSENVVDVELLTQGLHDLESRDMCRRIQRLVDGTDPEVYFGIALGFALCNNGLVGLKAERIPVAVPRAHDCITLFLGSKERYRDYFDGNPGTYFVTTGWQERDGTNKENVAEDSVMHQMGLDHSYEEYVRKYGEDNAKYLLETLGDGLQNYCRYAYIDVGLPGDVSYVSETEEKAKNRGWSFVRLEGDLSLMQNLVDGRWDEEDFVVLAPGERLVATGDSRVIDKSTNDCE